MKKGYFACAALVVASILIAALPMKKENTPILSGEKTEITSNTSLSGASATPSANDTKEPIKKSPFKQQKPSGTAGPDSATYYDESLNSYDTASPADTSWQISDTYTANDYPLPPAITEAVSITLEAQAVRSLKPGNTMKIVLPDYSAHNAKIEQVNESRTSKTLTGFLTEKTDSQIIITAGKNTVYATISTAEGNYSLEASGGEGILYKIPLRSDIETIETDALIPDMSLLDPQNEEPTTEQ